MTENELIIQAFADSFDPPLTYCRTERINGKPAKDAWTCSIWNQKTGFGGMAVAYEGSIRCFMEGAGKSVAAAEFYGRAMSNAITLAPIGDDKTE